MVKQVGDRMLKLQERIRNELLDKEVSEDEGDYFKGGQFDIFKDYESDDGDSSDLRGFEKSKF